MPVVIAVLFLASLTSSVALSIGGTLYALAVR